MTDENMQVAEPEAQPVAAPESADQQAPMPDTADPAIEAAPDTGEGEPATPESDADDQRKAKGGFQRRIDELTREKYEARQEAEQLRQAAEAARQQLMQQQAASSEAPPTFESAGYDEAEYQRQIVDWNQRQQNKQHEYAAQLAQQEQARAEQYQEQVRMQKKFAEATKVYPDFMLKVNDPSVPPLTQLNPAAASAIIESDHFADVSYYLSSNLDEMYALAELTPIQAIKKVAQLEQKFSAKPKSTSRLPSPPGKIEGGPSGTGGDPERMTTSEWMEWRRKQLYS